MSEDRDFIGEMDALIDAATQGSDWVPAVVASKLAASADPDLLDGWLHEMAEHVLCGVITQRERNRRTVARSRASSRTFAAAAEAFENGDSDAMGSFAVTFAVDEENTRRRVADMTGEDHVFVADDYAGRSKKLAMESAFHRAVAKKVGKKRTCDVYTEAQYDAAYRSITGKPATAKAA